MPKLPFTVDSALLQELGERLVGKPHVALAELIKNSYDADANNVFIRFLPDQDRIEIVDDGHGMEFDEFRNYWMRIGSQHKSRLGVSRKLKRPLTGSKGVGRLAVQFLAHELELETVSSRDRHLRIRAHADWDTLVNAGELTNAEVEYHTNTSNNGPFEKGTRLVLNRLKHEWTADELRGLAKEIWWLQPPFKSPPPMRARDKERFQIAFSSTEEDAKVNFEEQMRAIMGIWMARLVGQCSNGKITLSLQFADRDEPIVHSYSIAGLPNNNGTYNDKVNLNNCDFEIRVFKLQHKQPHGISVEDAREYFRQYGGVHVYDSGFRLPYYGNAENDWLRVQLDHARRISNSELLPKELRVEKGMTFLPTLSRIFGVVNVNTARESNLKILVTRDRLGESKAYDDLASLVRYALDFYAQNEAQRAFEVARSQMPVVRTVDEIEDLLEALERHQDDIPEPVYDELKQHISNVSEIATKSESATRDQVGVLGPLASAGISALAYQHEIRKQFIVVEGILERIHDVKSKDAKLQLALGSLAKDLADWLTRARATNALFDYYADPENVQTRKRKRAMSVLNDIKSQTLFLARGADVSLAGVDADLLLPNASLAEWGAVFQNVLSNAFAATLDSPTRLIYISSRKKGRNHEILVQDTGCGIDLQEAGELFEPFKRKLNISPERQALGYGGMGLGLAIVRMVAERIGCKVGFVEPEHGFNTAFSLSWREAE